MNAPAMLDPAALAWLGGEHRTREVLEAFVDAARRDVAALEASGAGIAEVRRVAHHLCGSSGMVGAFELAGVVGRLEAAALAGAADEIPALVAQARAALTRLVAHVRGTGSDR